MWFHQIPDARVLVHAKGGVFSQKPVFRGPHNRLYFQHGTGFVRIGPADATSCPTLSVVAFDLPFTPGKSSAGPVFEDNAKPYRTEGAK